MKKFRVFTNNRLSRGVIKMYSAFAEVTAKDEITAIEAACIPIQFCEPPYARPKAIHWPKSTQTQAEKDWLEKHVEDDFFHV